ncbi:PFS2 [Candida oxycetoniae]|uniref:Polyadenylation factor subunit 2 n=1 Tax=Candida oxycetoniae TaxID=497107 RepID=A0AAI9SY96_9ASCO|nr:PFS2 [Candida oxycetoniae]KAI3404810.1 PFS2 [Candida oxycetoniae]
MYSNNTYQQGNGRINKPLSASASSSTPPPPPPPQSSQYGNREPRQQQDRSQFYQQNLDHQLASQDKKQAFRRITDHGSNMGRWYIEKSMGINTRQQQPIGAIRPESSYLIDLLPTMAYSSSFNRNRRNNKNNLGILDLETKFVHLSSSKVKHSINTVKWTPEGRRLLVAAHSGEFTLWNGMTFNFETIMQAHESPILTMQYSNNDDWLLSGDQNGTIKYWQPNFNNVNNIMAHSNGVRDIAFSPNDSKFLTCGDDSLVKIWNFSNGKEERSLSGHNWEVKSADWHKDLGLIVSGSKDNLVKLWDPRVNECIATLHGFKHTVNTTRFQPCGTKRLLASVSRDRSCRVFDLTTMKDMLVIRDSETDLSCCSWHPQHASLLTTAAFNGSINHYLLNSYIPNSNDSIPKRSLSSNVTSQTPSIDAVHKIPYAHERAVHALEYHPMGHLLCSAGSDKTARFWSRARPNDPMAWKDPVYTDEKNGAWYYAVNNNVNAVMEDPTQVSSASGSSGEPNTASATNQAVETTNSVFRRDGDAHDPNDNGRSGLNFPSVHLPGLRSFV